MGETDMAHLECLRADQKAAAKRNLMRMTNDSDETLITMCFTSWAKNKEEEKKQKLFEEREDKLQKQLADMQGKSGGWHDVEVCYFRAVVSNQTASWMFSSAFLHKSRCVRGMHSSDAAPLQRPVSFALLSGAGVFLKGVHPPL